MSQKWNNDNETNIHSTAFDHPLRPRHFRGRKIRTGSLGCQRSPAHNSLPPLGGALGWAAGENVALRTPRRGPTHNAFFVSALGGVGWFHSVDVHPFHDHILKATFTFWWCVAFFPYATLVWNDCPPCWSTRVSTPGNPMTSPSTYFSGCRMVPTT